MVTLELRGRLWTLTCEQAERLRLAADAHAAVSVRAKSLALVLEWASSQRNTVRLKRGEGAELRRLLQERRSLADIAELVDSAERRRPRRRLVVLPSESYATTGASPSCQRRSRGGLGRG